jgi:HEAT repeat protein
MAAGSVILVGGCQPSGCRSGSPPEPTVAPTAHSAVDDAVSKLIGKLRVEAERDDAIGALAALGETAIPALGKALKSGDAEARIAVVDALERIGTPAVTDALLTAFGDADEDVRYEAVEALGVVRDRRAVQPLLARYAKDNDDQVRYEILTTLGLIGDPAAGELLVAETRSEDRYERMWAMDALCTMKHESAPRLVVTLLRDSDIYVRRQVLSSCPKALDTPDGHAALIRTSLDADDFDEAVRARRNLETYLKTLAPGSELQKHIRDAARPALQGEHPVQAALLLADVGDSSGTAQLIAALEHPNYFVRHHAAYQLGRVGGPEAVPPLIGALQDKQALVAATAYDALVTFAEQGDGRAKKAVESYKGTKFDQKLAK